MSNNPSKKPAQIVDIADIMILLTRYRSLERCQYGLLKVTTTSSLVAANVFSDVDPLFCIIKESEDLTKISNMMDSFVKSDRKVLQETLPTIFEKDGVLSDMGCDLILVFLYLSGGSAISIAETMMMLYSIEVKDLDITTEAAAEASNFLKPYLQYFTERFVDKSSGLLSMKLKPEAEDRIDVVITQLKQSSRNVEGLSEVDMSGTRTVH